MKILNSKLLYSYAYLLFTLLIVVWIGSFLEWISANYNTNFSVYAIIIYKFINDFWAIVTLGIILFPLFWLCSVIFKKRVISIFQIVFILILFIQVALIKYSLTTQVNLGADLLGYSYDDILTTIKSSVSLSFITLLPFLVLIGLFYGVYILLKKWVLNSQILIVSILLVLLFGSLKLVLPNTSNELFQNKVQYLTTDIINFQTEKYKTNANLYSRNDYPLLEPSSKVKDVLKPFFNILETKPTIVIIIVEGLGGEFIGNHSYAGFTPYLDSLIPKSLYWENFLSNAGRTFGVLPSLTASLPFGDKGFLEIPDTPSHITLISVLKANGYTTSYYSGGPSSFDRKINFLEYNQLDDVIDESKYGLAYKITKANDGGFSWGYPDEEIFKKMLVSIQHKKSPRLDIVMTLSNHEPFTFPNKETYLKKVDSILNSGKVLKISKEKVQEYKEIYASLLYTDTSIKNFMEAYSKRLDYKNTIFIITGDHRLIPITQKDKLCRFHVPLFITSPLLKKTETFKSVSSHWDITPSLLSFLMNNYKMNPLDEVAWISQGLDTAKQFRNIHQIAFMRYKGKINDFMLKDYLYSAGSLYKINENFGIYKVKEEKLQEAIKDSLDNFKNLNAYLTKRDKIYPDSLNIYRKPNFKFTKTELATIKKLTKGLDFDQIFNLARENAFSKKYKTALLLCNYILNELPNHADARTLKGRVLAWNGNYKKSESTLLNVIKRNPYYSDSYSALLDLYWWSDQDEKALGVYRKAIQNKLTNSDIAFKMAKAYKRLKISKQSGKIIDSLLLKYPENKEYKTFKQKLKN
ncbi:MAG: sulfatase-like hydrolase/transferase [Lutibacter sp.]|uniref:sulfatase-like hydrolase/transferase n=1 Tax=Lutibacter sp. TaxID=1925666 RepID=UPI00385AD7E6